MKKKNKHIMIFRAYYLNLLMGLNIEAIMAHIRTLPDNLLCGLCIRLIAENKKKDFLSKEILSGLHANQCTFDDAYHWANSASRDELKERLCLMILEGRRAGLKLE